MQTKFLVAVFAIIAVVAFLAVMLVLLLTKFKCNGKMKEYGDKIVV